MNRNTRMEGCLSVPKAKLCPEMFINGKVGKSLMGEEQTQEEYISRGCFFCKSGKEIDVIRHFNATFPDGKAIMPTRTKIKRTRESVSTEQVPLLPGYVFFEIAEKGLSVPGFIDSTLTALQEFSRIDSVLKLLRYSDGKWRLFGSDNLFAEMLFKTEGNIGLSLAFFDKGDRIRIIDGFLKDYEGCITSVNRKNKTVEVTVNLQGKKVILRLGYELVEPVSDSSERTSKHNNRHGNY